MTTLYIVSGSPASSNALERALDLASTGDAILLIENGVYAACDTPRNRTLLQTAPAGLSCFVLAGDLAARALPRQLTSYSPVTYAGFVELVCQHDNNVSWS